MTKNIWLLNWYYLFRKAPILFLLQNLYFIKLGFNSSDVFFANSIQIGVYLIADYFCSWFSDKNGKKLSLIIGLYLNLFYIAFAYLAQNTELFYLYLSFGAQGLARAFYGTSDLLYDYQIVEKEDSITYPQFRGNLRSFINFGFLIASITGTYLLTHSLNSILVLSVFMILLAHFALTRLPTETIVKFDTKSTLKDIIKFIKKNYVLLSIGILFGSTYLFLEIGVLQLVGKELGVSENFLGIATSLVVATGILSSILAKWFLSFKIKKKNSLLILLLMKTFCMALWLTCNIYLITIGFIIYQLIITLFWALYDELFFEKLPKTLMARINSVRWICAAAIAITLNQTCAVIIHQGAQPLIYFIVSIIIAILVTVALLIRKCL